MQQLDYFEKVLKSIVSDEDLSTLSLKNSGDSFSKLCRAFIIKFFRENRDFNEAISIYSSVKDDLSLKLFDNFFNSDTQKITFNHNRKNKDHIWDIFCPEALESYNKPEEIKNKILRKRKLTNLKRVKISYKPS